VSGLRRAGKPPGSRLVLDDSPTSIQGLRAKGTVRRRTAVARERKRLPRTEFAPWSPRSDLGGRARRIESRLPGAASWSRWRPPTVIADRLLWTSSSRPHTSHVEHSSVVTTRHTAAGRQIRQECSISPPEDDAPAYLSEGQWLAASW